MQLQCMPRNKSCMCTHTIYVHVYSLQCMLKMKNKFLIGSLVNYISHFNVNMCTVPTSVMLRTHSVRVRQCIFNMCWGMKYDSLLAFYPDCSSYTCITFCISFPENAWVHVYTYNKAKAKARFYIVALAAAHQIFVLWPKKNRL